MNRIFALISFVVLFALGIQLKLDTTKTVEVEEDEITKPQKLRKKKDSERMERRPASIVPSNQQNTQSYRTVDKDRNVFQDAPEQLAENIPEQTPVSNKEPYKNVQGQVPSDFRPSPEAQRAPAQDSKSYSKKETSMVPSGGPRLPPNDKPGGSPCLFCIKPPTPTNDGDPSSTGGSSGSVSGDGVSSLNCTASVGSGSFANPFAVSLNCSTAADIKFTISETICGDPDTGSSYSSSFTVNPGAGTYCLSFKGTTSAGVESSVVEKFYTFNPALPDIQVAHIKTYFQTTELQGLMSVTSTDFSDPDYSMGVVNLKTHDPGLAGLNWLCHEIVEDQSTLSSPTPVLPMIDTNVSGFAVSSQVDIFLQSINLGYGNNFVTSYLRNNNFVEPVYSCSTTNIILEDFPYFDSNPQHGYAGSDNVREFSGGFTHLGFFEPEPTVYRGPAGVDSQTTSAQELETGLFSIFY